MLAALALALPVLGLAGTLIASEAALSGATVWRISITGYDPRDPLRGHYIRFQYTWNLAGRAPACADMAACQLCLTDGGRAVTIEPQTAVCPAAVDPRASGLSVFPDGRGQVTAATRLWVSEASAPALEADLRVRPMVAVARLTRSGRLVAERLEPAP